MSRAAEGGRTTNNRATDAVLKALDRVVDPCSIATGVPITIRDMGLIEEIKQDQWEIVVHLRLTSPFCPQVGNLIDRIDEVTRDLVDVARVRVEFDSGTEWMPDMMAPAAQRRLRAVRPLPLAEDGQSGHHS